VNFGKTKSYGKSKPVQGVRGRDEKPEARRGWRVLRPSESAVEWLPRPLRLQVAHHGDRLSMASQYNAKSALPEEMAVKH
jgi:hypothetical protein